MTHEGLPDVVASFIAENLFSVEQLEILLLLHKHADREWTAAEVCDVIRTNVDSISNRLDDLITCGLAVRRTEDGLDHYRFLASTNNQFLVDGVARFYASHRVSVINLMFSKPIDMIRSFSDAFRIRKEGRKPR